ncbi:MAG TPA: carbon-nitrogen hydrolase [Nitrospinaceae bacterium]|jgi:N-carbamoylputrescine amidase|nr:carbon-nitrogen hydrolase [Nitrospinaceae bacterium]HJO01186.1 carbon-nitrogen hydrolase [Nitrospinaceae bacterium]
MNEYNTRVLGLIQQTRGEDLEQNLATSIQAIRSSAEQGAQIICLQELFRSKYFCQTEDSGRFDLAETIPGPTTQTLSQLAKELEVVIIAPLFEKRAEGIYHNTAVAINADGSIAGIYRKTHIPDDPCFYEKYYFTPGDTGFKSFPTRYGRVGVLICWDQWFPEAARLTALSGAQFIFYPTAIGYQDCDASELEKQAAAWETIQKSHAIANGVFVAAVNRVGREGALTFWGRSFVCDPFGKVTAKADENNPENLIVECDLSDIEQIRQNWPFLRDRRVDAYQKLIRIYDDPHA